MRTHSLSTDEFVPIIPPNPDDEKHDITVDTFEDWLLIACADGDIASIRRILDAADVDVEYSGKNCVTPLFVAAKYGRLAAVKLLVELGANIETQDPNGDTPLMVACRRRHKDVVEYLISKGANIETVDRAEVSPLAMALHKGYTEIAILLLDKGASLTINSQSDQTRLLIYCVKNGRVNFVSWLLDRGSAIDTKDKEGNTLLHMACKKGQLQVVQFLLERGAHLEARNNLGRTPLHEATYHDHSEIIKFLVTKGSHRHAKDKFGKTPHMVASNVRIQRMLSDRKVPSRCYQCIQACGLGRCAIRCILCYYNCTFALCLPLVCVSYLCTHRCVLPPQEHGEDRCLSHNRVDAMMFWTCCGRNPWGWL